MTALTPPTPALLSWNNFPEAVSSCTGPGVCSFQIQIQAPPGTPNRAVPVQAQIVSVFHLCVADRRLAGEDVARFHGICRA